MFDSDEPVFMSVGHVPVTSITDGYADTSDIPNYFFPVKHCPFGGTLNIFGNFTKIKSIVPIAKYYAVKITKDDGSVSHFQNTWTVNKWNTIANAYEPYIMKPLPNTYNYEIPVNPNLFSPHNWMMRWPTGENGTYTLTIELYKSNGAPIDLTQQQYQEINNKKDLVLYIDNTPPQAVINEIRQKPNTLIKTCDIIDINPNLYKFNITAYDANRHLRYYRLTAYWGDNKSKNIQSDSYTAHIDDSYPWAGVNHQFVPVGTYPNNYFAADCDCAYTFYLEVWKRTINGYNYILSGSYHKSFTIKNTGNGLCH
jgi:hypothetical protein